MYKHITATGSRLNAILRQPGNPTDNFWASSSTDRIDKYSVFISNLSRNNNTPILTIMYGIINTFKVDFENNRKLVDNFADIFHVDSPTNNVQNNYIDLYDDLLMKLGLKVPSTTAMSPPALVAPAPAPALDPEPVFESAIDQYPEPESAIVGPEEPRPSVFRRVGNYFNETVGKRYNDFEENFG
jgi:hypothetical protein